MKRWRYCCEPVDIPNGFFTRLWRGGKVQHSETMTYGRRVHADDCALFPMFTIGPTMPFDGAAHVWTAPRVRVPMGTNIG